MNLPEKMTKEEILDLIVPFCPEGCNAKPFLINRNNLTELLADIYQKIENKKETIPTDQVNDLIEKYAHDYRNETYMIHEMEYMLNNFLTDYKNLHHENK